MRSRQPKRKRLNVTVLVDWNTVPDNNPEFKCAKPDFSPDGSELSTEFYVVNALRILGHSVAVLGVKDKVDPIVEHINEVRPDIVFNLTELFKDDRRFDSHIAALLEMFHIPFTGTGSAGLMICRHKGISKQLLASRKIKVPGYAVVSQKVRTRIPRELRYPMVVKPLYTDGSDGIHNASLVSNEEELRERACVIHERFDQDAIVEEFIDGRELYVTVMGNNRLEILPPRELFFGEVDNGGPKMATYNVKWNKEYQKKWGIRFGFAELDTATHIAVKRVCRRAYKVLRIQDYGRIDLRLTGEGKIVVIEANPNPGIAVGEEAAESARKAGINYSRFIDRIVTLALARYKAGGPLGY